MDIEKMKSAMRRFRESMEELESLELNMSELMHGHPVKQISGSLMPGIAKAMGVSLDLEPFSDEFNRVSLMVEGVEVFALFNVEEDAA